MGRVMAKPLASYHFAWLSKHPERTAEWLSERLADGFQVHHIDGDHGNDDPANLLLVDGADHLSLHAGRLDIGIGNWRAKQRKPRVSAVESEAQKVGREIYHRKIETELPWKEFAVQYHDGKKPDPNRIWSDIGIALQYKAKAYAKRNKMPWPPLAA